MASAAVAAVGDFAMLAELDAWVSAEVTSEGPMATFVTRLCIHLLQIWSALTLGAGTAPLTLDRLRTAWERIEARMIASWGKVVDSELKTGMLPAILAQLRAKKRDSLSSLAELLELLAEKPFMLWLSQTYMPTVHTRGVFKMTRRDANVECLMRLWIASMHALRAGVLAAAGDAQPNLSTTVRVRDLPTILFPPPGPLGDVDENSVFSQLMQHVDPCKFGAGNRRAEAHNAVRLLEHAKRLGHVHRDMELLCRAEAKRLGLKGGGGGGGAKDDNPTCPECEGELDTTGRHASLRCSEGCNIRLHDYCAQGAVGSADESEALPCANPRGCKGQLTVAWQKDGHKLVSLLWHSSKLSDLGALEKLVGTVEDEPSDEGAADGGAGDSAEASDASGSDDESASVPTKERLGGLKGTKQLLALIMHGGGGDRHAQDQERIAHKLEQAKLKEAKRQEEAARAAARQERLAAEEEKRRQREAEEASKPKSSPSPSSASSSAATLSVVMKGDVAALSSKPKVVTAKMAAKAEIHASAANAKDDDSDEEDDEEEEQGAPEQQEEDGDDEGFMRVTKQRRGYASSAASFGSSSSAYKYDVGESEEKRLARQRAQAALLQPSRPAAAAAMVSTSNPIPLPSQWHPPPAAASPAARDGVIFPASTLAKPARAAGWGMAAAPPPVENVAAAFPPLSTTSPKFASPAPAPAPAANGSSPFASATAASMVSASLAAKRAAEREAQELAAALALIAEQDAKEEKAARAAAKKVRLAEEKAEKARAEAARLEREAAEEAEEEARARVLKAKQKEDAQKRAAAAKAQEEATAAAAAASAAAAAAAATAAAAAAPLVAKPMARSTFALPPAAPSVPIVEQARAAPVAQPMQRASVFAPAPFAVPTPPPVVQPQQQHQQVQAQPSPFAMPSPLAAPSTASASSSSVSSTHLLHAPGCYSVADSPHVQLIHTAVSSMHPSTCLLISNISHSTLLTPQLLGPLCAHFGDVRCVQPLLSFTQGPCSLVHFARAVDAQQALASLDKLRLRACVGGDETTEHELQLRVEYASVSHDGAAELKLMPPQRLTLTLVRRKDPQQMHPLSQANGVHAQLHTHRSLY